jgi:FixJ family two-component response regulator
MASDNPAATRAVHIIDDDQALRESLAFLLRAAQLDFSMHCRMRPSVAS